MRRTVAFTLVFLSLGMSDFASAKGHKALARLRGVALDFVRPEKPLSTAELGLARIEAIIPVQMAEELKARQPREHAVLRYSFLAASRPIVIDPKFRCSPGVIRVFGPVIDDPMEKFADGHFIAPAVQDVELWPDTDPMYSRVRIALKLVQGRHANLIMHLRQGDEVMLLGFANCTRGGNACGPGPSIHWGACPDHDDAAGSNSNGQTR